MGTKASRLSVGLSSILWLVVGLSSFAAHGWAAKRAFVVGITDYDTIDPSVNSTNDASLVRQSIERFGYGPNTTFLKEKDASLSGFTAAWTRFLSTVEEGDDIIVYFSGHGFSYQGSNFLALRDVPKNSSHDDAVNYAKDISKLADNLTNKSVEIGLFIIEACRNDPFGYKDHDVQHGTTILNRLERSTDSSAIVVWYAASEGETSLATTQPGRESISLFTKIFAEKLSDFQMTDIERFAKEMRAPVLNASPVDHQQHPWLASNLTFDWCFGGKCPISDDRPQLRTFAAAGKAREVSLTSSNYLAFLSQSRLDGNAMFLGKKSALQNCHPGENDDRPFGCEVLATLARSDDMAKSSEPSNGLVDKKLLLLTATNLRLALPKQISADNVHALYSCPVRTYQKGAQLEFSRIVSLNYNKDIYYWGIIKNQVSSRCA